MPLSLEEFRATKSQPGDEFYAEIAQHIDPKFSLVPYEACFEYEGHTLIQEIDGQFWVHAWWYPPLPYATLAEAEEKLYPWYLEFAE